MVRNTIEPDPTRPPHDAERSGAQLDMLHSFAAKLNVLTETTEIGGTITGELRTIIDYHNCRVYLMQPDRVTLMPIAFRGEMTTEYFEEDLDALITALGEGITGTVAATRESLLTPDAREVPFSVTIEGTEDDLLESMLAVPMVAGDDVIGVIVLSSLGYGMFDDEDQRMLEVLAPHAAAAFQNARLLEPSARPRRLQERSCSSRRRSRRETLSATSSETPSRRFRPSSGASRRQPTYATTQPATSGSSSCTPTEGTRRAPEQTSPTCPAHLQMLCCRAILRRS